MGIADRVRIATLPVSEGEPLPLETEGQIRESSLGSSVRWSPDGRRLFYVDSAINERGWLFDMGRQQSHPTELTGLGSNGFIAWTPEGNISWQVTMPNARLNYRIRNLNTKEESLLIQEKDGGWIFDPHFSPGGREVAVMWNRPRPRGLWVLTWPERAARFLAEDRWPLGWTPDGKEVFVTGTGNPRTEVELVSAASGARRSLFTVKRGTLLGGSPTPDGRYFVMTIMDDQRDAWLITNFDPLVPQ